MPRRQYAGGAVSTTVTSEIAGSGSVTISVQSAVGWPDASVGPFSIVVDPGTASEEKMLVTARTGTNLTVTSGNRGYDGTTSTAHQIGAVVYPTLTAIDFDEANAHVNSPALHLGNNTVLGSHISAGAVGATQLASDSVTADKIASAAVGASELAANAVATANIQDSAITQAKLAPGVTLVVGANSVSTASIQDGAVTNAKLAGSIDASKISGTVVLTNDARLSNSRTPSGSAGGSLSGSYPNPTLASGSVGTGQIASGSRLVETSVGTVSMVRLGGTTDGSGNFTPSHSLGADLPSRILSAEGWYKGNSGEAGRLNVYTIDGTTLYASGGLASRACYIVVWYTNATLAGW